MVIKYDLDKIPKTKSDTIGSSNDHYKLKKILLKWVEPQFQNIEYIKYDECMISRDEAEFSFFPDAVIFQNGLETWFEFETSSFNVFSKLVMLSYLKNDNPSSWPNKIVFGIPHIKRKEKYVSLLKKIAKLSSIKKIALYDVDLSSSHVRKLYEV